MTDTEYSKLVSDVRNGVAKLLPYLKHKQLMETATDALITGEVKIPPTIIGVFYKPKEQSGECSVYYALVALLAHTKHRKSDDAIGRLRFSSQALAETLRRYENGYYK